MKAFICTGLTVAMMLLLFYGNVAAFIPGMALFFQLLAEVPGTLNEDKEKDTTAASSRATK